MDAGYPARLSTFPIRNHFAIKNEDIAAAGFQYVNDYRVSCPDCKKHSSGFVLGRRMPLQQHEFMSPDCPLLLRLKESPIFDRLSTFGLSFPASRCPIPMISMARAGFSSTGKDDKVECAACGVKYQFWRKDDDPMNCHLMYSAWSMCDFLVQEIKSGRVTGARVRSVVLFKQNADKLMLKAFPVEQPQNIPHQPAVTGSAPAASSDPAPQDNTSTMDRIRASPRVEGNIARPKIEGTQNDHAPVIDSPTGNLPERLHESPPESLQGGPHQPSVIGSATTASSGPVTPMNKIEMLRAARARHPDTIGTFGWGGAKPVEAGTDHQHAPVTDSPHGTLPERLHESLHEAPQEPVHEPPRPRTSEPPAKRQQAFDLTKLQQAVEDLVDIEKELVQGGKLERKQCHWLRSVVLDIKREVGKIEAPSDSGVFLRTNGLERQENANTRGASAMSETDDADRHRDKKPRLEPGA